MEELQDAIEDAQYVNAIHAVDDGPRPVLPWPVPNEEELAAWQAGVLAKSAAATASPEKSTLTVTPFGFEWTLSSALGFFLFAAYLKEAVKEHVEINFMELVIRWRDSKGRFRAQRTASLVSGYLPPLTEEDQKAVAARLKEAATKLPPASTEATASMAETDTGDEGSPGDGPTAAAPPKATGTPPDAPAFGPPKTEIDQYNLSRAPLICNYSEEELRDIRACGDPMANFVGVGGRILEGIRSKVSKLQKAPDFQSLRLLDEEKSDRESMTERRSQSLAELQLQGGGLLAAVVVEPPKRVKINTSSMRTMSMLSNALPETLFDEAEVLVAENVRERHWEGFRRSGYHTRLLHFLWFQDRTVEEEDFYVMRVLGRGGFGLVTACKKGTSGKLYAMKVMNKKRIKIKKAEQLTLNEQKCLADVNSPFVVNLKYSLQSKMDVFLILDLMTGGDLSFHLSRRGCFQPKECLYYGARIMLGLQALHDKGYVYRDLKPENCLLGEDGRVKLTDLGLAVKITRSLRGAAGTRGYWAPEMLRRDEHGKRKTYNQMVDWFSFGCCLAEFISGENPFRTETALKFGLELEKEKEKEKEKEDKKKEKEDKKKSKVSIFSPTERIKQKRRQQEKAIDRATLEMHPKFEHKEFDEDSADICRRLLDKNEHTRLGVSGSSELMGHPYFRRVDWEEILSDKAKPPFIPRKDVNAASQSEIGTFAEDKTFRDAVLDEKDEAVFASWNFTNTKAFAAEVIEFLIYERETGRPLLPIQQGDSCCCTII